MNKTEYPLMTQPLVHMLVTFLNSKKNKCSILEHGTGNSTIYWSKQDNVETVVSVEASTEWGGQVSTWLSDLEMKYSDKIEYNVIPLNIEELKNLNPLGGPKAWSNEYEEFWKPQTEFINNSKYKDMKFDLIIIDGYDRKRCFLNSIDLLKEDGWILMHDMWAVDFKKYDPQKVDIFDSKELEFVSIGSEQNPWGSGRGKYGFIMKKKETK